MHSYGHKSMSCKYWSFSGMRKWCSGKGIKPMCVFVVNLGNSNTLLPLWSQRHRHFWWWKSIWNCKHFWPQSSSHCSSGAPLSTNQPRESNIEWDVYQIINVGLYKAFTRLKSQALLIEVDRFRSWNGCYFDYGWGILDSRHESWFSTISYRSWWSMRS